MNLLWELFEYILSITYCQDTEVQDIKNLCKLRLISKMTDQLIRFSIFPRYLGIIHSKMIPFDVSIVNQTGYWESTFRSNLDLRVMMDENLTLSHFSIWIVDLFLNVDDLLTPTSPQTFPKTNFFDLWVFSYQKFPLNHETQNLNKEELEQNLNKETKIDSVRSPLFVNHRTQLQKFDTEQQMTQHYAHLRMLKAQFKVFDCFQTGTFCFFLKSSINHGQ